MFAGTKQGLLPVSVSGGFWTGSGAIVDLLLEHTDCRIIPAEFSLFSYGQFFEEVYHPLAMRQPLGDLHDLNLWRFRDFNRSELPLVKSAARYLCAKVGIFPLWLFTRQLGMNRKLGRYYKDACQKLLLLLRSVKQKGVYPEASEIQLMIQDILYEAAQGAATHGSAVADVAVFDQMVAPPYASYAWEALPELRIISVDRDWRDQYVELRNQIPRMISVKARLSLTAWGEHIRPNDVNPVPFFVRLRNRIEHVKAEQLKQGDNRLLWIRFEDIIYDTERIADTVFNFLRLDGSRWNSGTYFYPEISVKNIGKWRNSPYLNEIAVIEKKLGERPLLTDSGLSAV